MTIQQFWPTNRSYGACGSPGFTFLRDAVSNGYPFEETCCPPIVDEYIVAVGTSGDDTLERVRAIGDPKIRVIETSWNEKMGPGLCLRAKEDDRAVQLQRDGRFTLRATRSCTKTISKIIEHMDRYRDDPEVEALYLIFCIFTEHLAGRNADTGPRG